MGAATIRRCAFVSSCFAILVLLLLLLNIVHGAYQDSNAVRLAAVQPNLPSAGHLEVSK